MKVKVLLVAEYGNGTKETLETISDVETFDLQRVLVRDDFMHVIEKTIRIAKARAATFKLDTPSEQTVPKPKP